MRKNWDLPCDAPLHVFVGAVAALGLALSLGGVVVLCYAAWEGIRLLVYCAADVLHRGGGAVAALLVGAPVAAMKVLDSDRD